MPSHAQEFAAHNISLQENLLGNNTLSIKWSRGEVLNVDPLARNGQSSGVGWLLPYLMPSHLLLLRLQVPLGFDVMRS